MLERPTQPLFKHPGSKWTLANRYPAPQYDVIVEACAGAGAYALRYAEPDKHQVVINDADPSIASLWRWLLSVDSSVLRNLPTTELVEGTDLRTLGLPGEAANFIRRWQRVGKTTCWTVSKWNGKPGMWRPKVIEKTIATIAWIRSFKSPWIVSCCDCVQLPKGQVTYFVDPVYISKQSWYDAKHKDYAALADWCRAAPGQVIVCEEKGADWLPFRELTQVKTGAAHYSGKTMTEMIWEK